ncbi:MAG: hypothetical protein OCD76_11700 [Reichenbachiella sp.]
MKFTLLTLLFFCCQIYVSTAADTLSISDAMLKKRITVVASGNGGLGKDAAHLVITNNISTDLNIEIGAGLMLKSVDEGAQDLIILEEEILYVKARSVVAYDMFGACTQLSNYGPKSGEAYNITSAVHADLVKMAKIIAENEMQSSIGQSAVWAFTDNRDIEGVFDGGHVDASWDLAKIVAEYRRETPPKREEIENWPRMSSPRVVYSSRVDLVYHAPRDTKVQLAVYDSLGEVVSEQFALKSTFGGVHIYTIGINNMLYQEASFTARLKDANGNVLVEKLMVNGGAYEEALSKVLPIRFEYIVREASLISMRVYDENDELVQELFKNRKMQLSKRNASFKFIHAFAEGTPLKVKIENNKGAVLHVQNVVAN